MTQKLFRPYLSLPEISHILGLLAPALTTQEAKTAYGKLFKLKLEAEMGLRNAAWVSVPTISQKLGFESAEPTETMSGKEAWELFNQDPSKLSPTQIQLGKTYGWKERRMSPVEAALFEKEMGL